jgi:hypothetical protein
VLAREEEVANGLPSLPASVQPCSTGIGQRRRLFGHAIVAVDEMPPFVAVDAERRELRAPVGMDEYGCLYTSGREPIGTRIAF